ncbi:MAG: hypothetical protein KAF91_22705 [Nostoc sp. TH1S01]|nr:hypothetical protein [Nostoc sp. TH1S01]
MFFVSRIDAVAASRRVGAKARRINILFLLNNSIHPAFMQRQIFNVGKAIAPATHNGAIYSIDQ